MSCPSCCDGLDGGKLLDYLFLEQLLLLAAAPRALPRLIVSTVLFYTLSLTLVTCMLSLGIVG